MVRPPKYVRIVFYPTGTKVVPIGKTGRVTCTNLPDSLQELRDNILRNTRPTVGEPFSRGNGDDFILHNPCEVKYYTQGGKKLLKHLK